MPTGSNGSQLIAGAAGPLISNQQFTGFDTFPQGGSAQTITTNQTNMSPGSFIPFNPFSTGIWYTDDAPFEPTAEDKVAVAEAFADIKSSVVPVEKVEGGVANAHATKLKSLGFKKLSSKMEEVARRATKINMIALSGYLKIPAEKIKAAKEMIEGRSNMTRQLRLLETTIEKYVGQNHDENNFTLPPGDVLEKLAVAKKSELFDEFTILHVKAIPDPILLGKIKGEKDRFFIAEWGNDITLTELMG